MKDLAEAAREIRALNDRVEILRLRVEALGASLAVPGVGSTDRATDPPLSRQTAVQAVSRATGQVVRDITGPDRSAPVSEARQIAWFLQWRTGESLSAMGRAWGRDHSSVRYGVMRIRDRAGSAKLADSIRLRCLIWDAAVFAGRPDAVPLGWHGSIRDSGRAIPDDVRAAAEIAEIR